jgi:hypothetical protein
MSNLKASFFTALSDYLMTTLQFEDLPSVKWIDKDLGQVKLLHDSIIALPLPAILISFPNTSFDPQLGNDETGAGQLRIQTLFENYFDADQGSPNRDLAIQYFEFNERVHNAVTAFKMQHIAGIARTGENEDTEHDNVIVTEIIYHFTLFDVAIDPATYMSANLKQTFHKHITEDISASPSFIIP